MAVTYSHGDALICAGDEVVPARERTFDVPEEVFGAGVGQFARLGTAQSVVVRIAQRVWRQSSHCALCETSSRG